jgi:methionyl-tRNA synthetase
MEDRSASDYWVNADADTEVHHFIGKDIAYFHTLFWPAMLKSADYKTPNAVHVHGFLTVNGLKMSKSRGTFITARQFADHMNPWYLRYYYSTKLSNSIDDLDLNADEFVARTNAELVNNITNLISRTIGFLNKRLDSKLGVIPETVSDLMSEIDSHILKAREEFTKLRFSAAVRAILSISDIANNFVQHHEPWAKIKSDPEAARNDLTFVVNCIKVITVLLSPILPSYCKKVEEILGLDELKWEDAKFDLENRSIGKFEKLLDRLEMGAWEKLIEASSESLAPKKEEPKVSVPAFKEEISIEEFAKVDLRAGKILSAEAV